jgi:periplasmic divalent cation tolerance protein
MRLIYITASNAGEAKKISAHLLENRLVACTNIFPIESMYWWQDEIQENVEFVILAKTKDNNFEKVQKAIVDMHTYKLPAVYSWKVDKVHKKYADWIEKETQ